MAQGPVLETIGRFEWTTTLTSGSVDLVGGTRSGVRGMESEEGFGFGTLAVPSRMGWPQVGDMSVYGIYEYNYMKKDLSPFYPIFPQTRPSPLSLTSISSLST